MYAERTLSMRGLFRLLVSRMFVLQGWRERKLWVIQSKINNYSESFVVNFIYKLKRQFITRNQDSNRTSPNSNQAHIVNCLVGTSGDG